MVGALARSFISSSVFACPPSSYSSMLSPSFLLRSFPLAFRKNYSPSGGIKTISILFLLPRTLRARARGGEGKSYLNDGINYLICWNNILKIIMLRPTIALAYWRTYCGKNQLLGAPSTYADRNLKNQLARGNFHLTVGNVGSRWMISLMYSPLMGNPLPNVLPHLKNELFHTRQYHAYVTEKLNTEQNDEEKSPFHHTFLLNPPSWHRIASKWWNIKITFFFAKSSDNYYVFNIFDTRSIPHSLSRRPK